MGLDGAKTELYKAHQAGLDKYTYFLLAAAGASIGFAVQKTEGMKLTWWALPVGLAILMWGASFVCGCKNIKYTNLAISTNMDMLIAQGGRSPIPDVAPHLAAAFLRETTESRSRTSHTYSVWQFRLLILGAVSFIAWRVAEMIRIT